jgi:hypothetical protein
MNDVERVLRADLERFVDRLATSVPEGTHAGAVRSRIEAAEEQLARAYTALVEDYERWRLTLDDLENIWALAVWRASFAEEPVEAAPRAA